MTNLNPANGVKKTQENFSPLQSLFILIVGIIIAELVSTIVILNLIDLSYYLLIIVDIGIMAVIIVPLLYIFSVRPLLRQIERRNLSESILQARLRLVEFASAHPLSEILEYALYEIETLTGSTVSFFHFIETDQKTISLQTWSTNTLKNMCVADGKGSHYDLDLAGVWADAARERTPVIHNNYADLPHRKGLPEGHTAIIREMVIPILRENMVVGIIGVGNKPSDYSAIDVETASTFGDFTWDVVKYVQTEIDIQKSEEKFRTLLEWTYDWELWVDVQGNIGYISPSCERISGYSPEEFIANPKLVISIIHPDERQMMEDHQVVVHDTSASPITLEYRIIARDGSEHWIEHICRPLFGPEGQHLGRRISNRDITERIVAEKMIYEQNQKEITLTQQINNLQSEIGRDLHDTLGNHISFLRMNLEHLSEVQWNDPISIKIQIQNMTKAANETYEMVRAMLAVLQTDNIKNPLLLFTNYAGQISDRSQFHCEIINEGQPKQLSLYQIRQLFYIFREALGNIEKYADARHVMGKFIWGEQDLNLVISDDGVGFNPDVAQKAGHYGLKFMRERAELTAGSFNIKSTPGQGTTITVVVPYDGKMAS
jgi:PAS domain S-box-containing protein